MSVNQREERRLESFKKLKRIKILDFLWFFARSKMGFKLLENKEHFTIKFLPEGTVDIHQTFEGKDKECGKALKLNFKEFVYTLYVSLEQELPKIMSEIDITNPKYEGVEVYVLPKKEVMQKSLESLVKKRELRIDKNKLMDLVSITFLRDLPNYDFQVAFFEKEGEQALYRIEGRYFLLKIDDFKKLIDRIFEKFNIQEMAS